MTGGKTGLATSESGCTTDVLCVVFFYLYLNQMGENVCLFF
jgi:hypothetical protein